ncbi:hypothetical protein ACI68E_002997 [Malassezia pachydermatis]
MKSKGSHVALVQATSASIVLIVWGLVFYHAGSWRVAFPTLHHLCVSLGLYLIIQGVFVLQPTRTPEEKERGLLWHEIFTLGLGLPLMTYGVWVMWEMHDRPGSQHFVSWHGTLGIFIILALWLQSIFGIIMLWAYKPFFGTKARAQAMWKYHRMSGYTFIALITTELLLAFWEVKWIWRVATVPLMLCATILIVLMAYGMIMRIRPSKMGF